MRQLIQFDTNVDGVEWDEATQTFAVTTTSTTLGSAANPRAEMRTQTRVEHFDYVVCASGHYSTPNSPHFDGLEDFHGRVSNPYPNPKPKRRIRRRPPPPSLPEP